MLFNAPRLPALSPAYVNTATAWSCTQSSTGWRMPRSASCHEWNVLVGVQAAARPSPKNRPLHPGRFTWFEMPSDMPASDRWLAAPRRDDTPPLESRLARSHEA